MYWPRPNSQLIHTDDELIQKKKKREKEKEIIEFLLLSTQRSVINS